MQFKPRAKLENWKLIPLPGGEDPDRICFAGTVVTAMGEVKHGCITSPVLWYSHAMHVGETRNTFYELGEPNQQWINELGTIGRTVESFEPILH